MAEEIELPDLPEDEDVDDGLTQQDWDELNGVGLTAADLDRLFNNTPTPEELQEGLARVGGVFWERIYSRQYIAGARALLDQGRRDGTLNTFAVPCGMLQRHALESLLKEALAIASNVDAQVRKRPARPVPMTHDLQRLALELGRAMFITGVIVPLEITELVVSMHIFEDGDPTRFRYAQGTAKGKYAQESFPDETFIPVGDWQTRLEHIEHAHFRVPTNGESPTMLWKLVAIDHGLRNNLIDIPAPGTA